VKFLFLGAGGIGGLVGGRLVEAGADVTFLVREKRKAQLLQHGLQIESPLGNATLQVQAKLKSEIEPIYDLVFLTCKAYDLPSAIDSIRPALSDPAAILPVLNGIAHIARLNDEFGRKNVLGGTIKMQANLTSTGVVRQLSNWQTITLGEQDGSITERVKDAADLIAKTGIEVKLSQNVMGDLWFKLVHLSTGERTASTSWRPTSSSTPPDARVGSTGTCAAPVSAASVASPPSTAPTGCDPASPSPR
jgi:2-dehydropantoate 2-reductase